MLVSSAVILLGSLGVILAHPNQNGASSPSRRTGASKEAAAEGKTYYQQKIKVMDGAVSPRRRQRVSSDAELEEAQRLAYHRSRGLSDAQVVRSGAASPKKRFSESRWEDVRRLAPPQRIRSTSQADGYGSGSDSLRRSFSDVGSVQREALDLETQKQAALQDKALELERQKQATLQREALELETQRQAEREALELEARKKAQKEASELEAKQQAEKEKALREAMELETRKKALEQLQLEEDQKKALQGEKTQADGYASDTEALKRTQSLTRQDSQNMRKSKFLDFSTPKVFQSVCDLEKVKNNDSKKNEACQKQCIELSDQIDDVYKNYPHMVKVEALHSECSGFTQGSCKITFGFKGKRTAACTCLGWTDDEKLNFKSQYAAVCRASLSGLKAITNIDVATAGLRKGVKKMISKWRNRSKKSKNSK